MDKHLFRNTALLSVSSALSTSAISPCSSYTLKPNLTVRSQQGRYGRGRGTAESRLPDRSFLYKIKAGKQREDKHVDRMRGWWQWMSKAPVQATTRCCSHLHARTHARTYIQVFIFPLSLSLMHTLSASLSLSQHSAPPSHYLLVKPMPELGEETKRHWEDYYWKDLCSSHHMYLCDNNTTMLGTSSEGSGSGAWQAGFNYRVDQLFSGMQITVAINTHHITASQTHQDKDIC